MITRIEVREKTVGGLKSDAHVLAQERLERIFKWTHDTNQEEPVVAIDGQTYYIDVCLRHKTITDFIVAGLEADTYVYGSQKKKSPKHMQQRDEAIMRTIKKPIIRFDIDALKEGRRKTKYYMTDEEIRLHVHEKITQFWSNPEEYIRECQRD